MTRLGGIAGAAFAVICVTGCTLGPEYQAPVPPEGATASLSASGDGTTIPAKTPDAWWRLYNDPVLDGLLDEALAANLDLKTSEARLTAARAIFEAARAGLYPTTKAEAAGTYGRDARTDEILELTGRRPVSDWTFDSVLDASYELDLFGRVRRSIEAAKASAEASAAGRDMLKVTVAAETARAYAQICTFGEQISVANRSLALVGRQEEIASERFQAGANSNLDVVRAQGLVAQVRSTIPPLEAQRRAAMFQLTTLIGRTPGDMPATVNGCAELPRLRGPIPIGDGAMLLKRRPDIREADRVLASSVAQIGVATADLYPRISLTGLYGGVSDKIDQLATANALTWGVGPSISWNFPIQSGPRARVRQAEANAVAALSNFDAVVLKALQETAQALSTYSAELDHHAALLEVQTKSQTSFALAQDQVAAGSLSNLDLLTAEQGLVAADAAVAASDGAIVQNQIAVFKALGGGWVTEIGQK